MEEMIKGPSMRDPVELENIEEMRRREGIDDVKLEEEMRGLQVGDLVRLTFLTKAAPVVGETLLVRMTSISGDEFLGKLTQKPGSPRLSKLRAGAQVAFRKAHIHSIAKEQPTHGRGCS
jgi:hypothetical protein